MDLDEKAVAIVTEAEALSETDLRAALGKMREALAIEPDYPNLEDEIFIREDAVAKLDGVLEFIVVLLREDKAYQACEMLQELPDNYIIQDKSGLVGGLVEKITNVQNMVEQARDIINTDRLQALSILENAFKIVPDFPSLADDVTNIKQDLSRYDAFITSIEKALGAKDVGTATDFLVNFKELYPDDEKIRRFKVDIINLSKTLKKNKDKKIDVLKITAVVLALFAIVGGYFAYEMFVIEKAARKWGEVERLLVANKFSETQAACLDINGNLDKIHLFFLNRKNELQGKVDSVLKSEVVVRGVEGKVLFDGDYIPKDQLGNSQELKKMIEEAQALAATGKYREAINKFEEVLTVADSKNLATANTEKIAEVIADVKLSIERYRISLIGNMAAKSGALISTGANYAALSEIDKAIAMIEKYSIERSQPVVGKIFAIRETINLEKYKKLIGLADKLFIDHRYDEAVNAYAVARDFARQQGVDRDVLGQKISEMTNKSMILAAFENGDGFMAASRWQEATLAYGKGLTLAQESELHNLPSIKLAQGNLQKAKKMMEVANLGSQNSLANQYLQSNVLIKAKNVFVAALKVAEKSVWREESEIVAIVAELRAGLADVEEKIFIGDKKKFLRDRYANIIKKDFKLGGATNLLEPEVVLLTATDQLLKFKISAISYVRKGGSGKYSRYEVIYEFDRKKKAWVLVDKASSSKVTAEKSYN